MKTNIIIVTCLFLGMSVACKAQKAISKIDAGIVKSKGLTYKLDNSNSKYIEIKNTANQLANVKYSAPNWPANLSPSRVITTDRNVLVAIFREVLNQERIKQLPTGRHDALFIHIKSDLNGKTLNISFVAQKNSTLTIEDLEKIENEIKKRVKVHILPDYKRFLVGANYIVLDVQIYNTELSGNVTR
jgi:ABC-type phosphate/phosphonate transport system substrate-binding protein